MKWQRRLKVFVSKPDYRAQSPGPSCCKKRTSSPTLSSTSTHAPSTKKKSKLNVKKQNKKKYLSLFNNLIQLFLFVLCFLTLKFFWEIYFWWECVQVKTSAPRSTSSDPLTPEIQALERWLTLSAEDRAWVSCKNSVCCNFWAGTHSNPKTCEFENFNLFSYSMKKC